jgi:acyl dehydratase
MNYMDLPNPVFIGDTLSLEAVVSDRIDVDSRDDAGIVILDCTMTNQEDTVVFEGDMKFLIKARGG